MSLYVIFGYNTKPNPNRTADQMVKEGPISGSAGHNSVKKGDRVMKIFNRSISGQIRADHSDYSALENCGKLPITA